jgi:tRNA(fMet)-specific endonuclease VapC
MFVLDTDHVTLVQWGRGSDADRLRSRLLLLGDEMTTTIISYEEQARGWLAYVAKARQMAQQINAYMKRACN